MENLHRFRVHRKQANNHDLGLGRHKEPYPRSSVTVLLLLPDVLDQLFQLHRKFQRQSMVLRCGEDFARGGCRRGP